MAPTTAQQAVYRLTLSKPITTHQGVTSELLFKPANAGLLMKFGRLPFRIKNAPDGAQEIETDFALAARYLEELTGVEQELLAQMTTTDFGAAMRVRGRLEAAA
jgi:hypothetical protein